MVHFINLSKVFQQFPKFATVSVLVVIEVVVVVFVVVMVDMFVIMLVVLVLVHFLTFRKVWSRGWQVIPSFSKCE